MSCRARTTWSPTWKWRDSPRSSITLAETPLDLGVLQVVFFVPQVAPLVQAGTLVYVLSAAWRGSLDPTSVILGAAGLAMGFDLFLATESIWIL